MTDSLGKAVLEINTVILMNFTAEGEGGKRGTREDPSMKEFPKDGPQDQSLGVGHRGTGNKPKVGTLYYKRYVNSCLDSIAHSWQPLSGGGIGFYYYVMRLGLWRLMCLSGYPESTTMNFIKET